MTLSTGVIPPVVHQSIFFLFRETEAFHPHMQLEATTQATTIHMSNVLSNTRDIEPVSFLLPGQLSGWFPPCIVSGEVGGSVVRVSQAIPARGHCSLDSLDARPRCFQIFYSFVSRSFVRVHADNGVKGGLGKQYSEVTTVFRLWVGSC